MQDSPPPEKTSPQEEEEEKEGQEEEVPRARCQMSVLSRSKFDSVTRARCSSILGRARTFVMFEERRALKKHRRKKKKKKKKKARFYREP